jgi:hypothetical protein
MPNDATPSQPSSSDESLLLTDASAEALAAALEHHAAGGGEDAGSRGAAPTKPVDAAARRVFGLLHLLDVPSSERAGRGSSLLDVTMARLHADAGRDTAARIDPDASGTHTRLTRDDREAVDAYFNREPADAAGVDQANTANGVSERERRIEAIFAAIDESAAASDAAGKRERIERTLSAIEAQSASSSLGVVAKLSPPSSSEFVGTRGNMRMRDFVAIAAAVLIAAVLFVPMSRNAERAQRAQMNQANLISAGVGSGLYAGDHDGQLPHVAERADAPRWWLVGTPEHSHSANLFVLVREGYAPFRSLASPLNRFAPTHRTAAYEHDWRESNEVSYSYQLFGKRAPRLSDRGLVILLSDRSPVAQQFAEGVRVDAARNSAQQNGAGQQVVFRDFSSAFLTSPTALRPDGRVDNIWAPDLSVSEAGRRRYAAPPLNPTDIFLGP